MPIRVIHSGDQHLDQFQLEVARAFAELPSSPLDSVDILESLDVVAGVSTTFDHRLGRVHRGMLVIRRSLDVRIWEPGDRKPGKLVLQSNINATISVLVF